jgi:hypothetical protein
MSLAKVAKLAKKNQRLNFQNSIVHSFSDRLLFLCELGDLCESYFCIS